MFEDRWERALIWIDGALLYCLGFHFGFVFVVGREGALRLFDAQIVANP
jgi:hypothetical protein